MYFFKAKTLGSIVQMMVFRKLYAFYYWVVSATAILYNADWDGDYQIMNVPNETLSAFTFVF